MVVGPRRALRLAGYSLPWSRFRPSATRNRDRADGYATAMLAAGGRLGGPDASGLYLQPGVGLLRTRQGSDLLSLPNLASGVRITASGTWMRGYVGLVFRRTARWSAGAAVSYGVAGAATRPIRSDSPSDRAALLLILVTRWQIRPKWDSLGRAHPVCNTRRALYFP